MSQIRLTNAERMQALQRLGYTDREASFLCLAALHGGYFLRRQYGQFLGHSLGGTAAALIEKLLAKGHVQVATYAATPTSTTCPLGHFMRRSDRKTIGTAASGSQPQSRTNSWVWILCSRTANTNTSQPNKKS